MSTNANAIINVLPQVSSAVQVYFTVINQSDNSLNQATITDIDILYGNVIINSGFIFIAYDNNPIALKVSATYEGDTYVSILYTKAVYGNTIPDNFSRLVQHTPSGIFDSFISEIDADGNELNLIVALYKTLARMTDDYYRGVRTLDGVTQFFNISLFDAINQVYSTTYSPELEYEYNGTVGLLGSSVYPNELFQLLATLDAVYLNSYALELFVSQYIYYRLGVISAVYIDDHVYPPSDFWILGNPTQSVLGTTTILAPAGYSPVLTNLKWYIYNASTFTQAFKNELSQLVRRISRADVGNHVFTKNIVDPVDDGFTLIGPTYQLDPRTLYDKCIQYIGDTAFPLNIIGYVKNF